MFLSMLDRQKVCFRVSLKGGPRWALIFLAGSVGIMTGTSQSLHFQNSSAPGALDNLPFLDLSSPVKAHENARIDGEEAARAQRYDNENRPPLYNELNPMKSGSTWVVGHKQYGLDYKVLPTSEADLIVIGRINSERPYLSKDGGSVYSLFSFSPSSPTSFLKGLNPTPLLPLTLEREGGVILLPSGKKRFEGMFDEGIPLPGHTYLLFLQSVGTGTCYKIITGYSLDTSPPSGIDRVDERVKVSSASELISDVRQKLANLKD